MKKLCKVLFFILVVFCIVSSIIGVYAKEFNLKKIEEDESELTNGLEKIVSQELFTVLEKTKTTVIDEKTAINKAMNYSGQILGNVDKKASSNEKEIATLIKENITMKGNIYWEVETQEYRAKIDTKSGSLISISSTNEIFSKCNYKEDIIKEVAIKLYNSLNLNNNYEFRYLEMFDDELWTVYFADKIDGIYNDFKAVKFTFSPVDEKIKHLVISDELIENSKINVSEKEAINIALKELGIQKHLECKTDIGFVRPNNYLKTKDYSSYKLSAVVKKAWIVTVDNKFVIHVDVSNGKVIGGGEY